MNGHEHGPHECYCPRCGYTETVEESVKCNTLTCPICGDRLRAVETGEFRSRVSQSQIGQAGSMATQALVATAITALFLFVLSRGAK